MSTQQIILREPRRHDFWRFYASDGGFYDYSTGKVFGYGELGLKPWLNFVIK